MGEGGKLNLPEIRISRDKKPRDKAAEGFARTPQEKGFCFKVTALPTCHPPPPTSQHVSPAAGCKFKGLHLVTDEDTGAGHPEPTVVCVHTMHVHIHHGYARPGRVQSHGRVPSSEPPYLLASRLLTHPTTLNIPSPGSSSVSGKSHLSSYSWRSIWNLEIIFVLFLSLFQHLKTEAHLCCDSVMKIPTSLWSGSRS